MRCKATCLLFNTTRHALQWPCTHDYFNFLLRKISNIGRVGVPWWCSGLSIWCCHYSGSSCCCGMSLIPGWGTSAWRVYGWGKKKRQSKQNSVALAAYGTRFSKFSSIKQFLFIISQFPEIRGLGMTYLGSLLQALVSKGCSQEGLRGSQRSFSKLKCFW